nr:RNA-directed DNA polymerase, eukaryota [Tanacetum cinerariifolium]
MLARMRILGVNHGLAHLSLLMLMVRGLLHLKLQTRLWVRDKKESATTKKAQLKGMLKDIDLLIDEKKVDQELLNKRMNVINLIHDLEKLEATEIAQKAKIKWSIEGGENFNFFHGILNKKRNQHAIRGILSEGNWIEDPNPVKNEFFSHFKERFDSPCSSRLMLEGGFSNKLCADQSIDLESNVTIEEIKRAVWDCGIDKSLRPDGFTFGFYRRYWDIIKKDAADAVSFFFISGNFPKGGNSSFISLIPKMQDTKVVKDYRPISLIESLYKIIAKILANRLVGVLGKLVNEVQSACIVNRQILDGPFILDELIHWCHAKKKVTMIFRVDFKKAYDSVRWDYLDDVLNKFRDGVKMEQFRALSIVIEGFCCMTWLIDGNGLLKFLNIIPPFKKNGEGIVNGCLRDIENYLKDRKLVAIIKSYTPNALDLTLTLKDLSCIIPGTIHNKVIDEEGYYKDINIGSALIVANVLVFL